jgi:ribonuclease HI
MIRIFTDGAAQPNPGSKGIGVVVEWQGTAPTIVSKHTGIGTNNEAEYEALIEALQVIRDEQIMKVQINSDSNLMVNQVNGNWKCKDHKLSQLCFKAQKRIEWLKERNYEIELIYTRREFNLADEPAKRGAEEGK